jgi:hypothetical protein
MFTYYMKHHKILIIPPKNVNNKTCNYFEDKKKLNGITTKSFTQIMKT